MIFAALSVPAGCPVPTRPLSRLWPLVLGEMEGWSSPVTALALVFAFIVMYDAAGVRLAASKQAASLNKLVDELFEEGEFHQERLKELLGHTPVEVFCGALLGVVISALLLR